MSLDGNHVVGDPGHTSDHDLIDTELASHATSITTLTTGVAGKAAASHTHNEGDVTSLVGDLAGKANASHTHVEGDVASLTTDLGNKVDKSVVGAKGYLIVGNGAGSVTGIGVGSDGQVLTADSAQTAGVKWAAGGGGGGGGSLTIQDENVTVATGVTQIDFQGGEVTAASGSGEVVVTIPTALTPGNNLSDVSTPATARTNLGLGTAATQASTAFDASGAAATAQAASLQKSSNLSDVASAATSRTNLGLGTAATHPVGDFAQTANNLSDLASAATARTNLGAAATSHSHAEADVTSLTTDLAAKQALSTLTTKGDLYVATASATAARLGVGADGTALVADSSQSTGLKWTTRSKSLSDTHTDQSALNTAAEVVVASQAIPTTVAPGDVLRLVAWGDMLNNSGSAVNYGLKVIVGATAVLTSNSASITANVNRRDWYLTADLLVVAAASDQRIGAQLILTATNANAFSFGTGSSSFFAVGRGTAAEDLTAGKNFQFSVTPGTAASTIDWVCHESVLMVEKR